MKLENKDKYVVGNVESFGETKGYFVGKFLGGKGYPDLETEEVEVAWKHLPTTFEESKPHFHKIGVEVNIVISGGYRLKVNEENIELKTGDFLVVYPETTVINLSTNADTVVLVIKAPSVSNDKFDLD